jgi:hypothetical protein
MINLIKDSFNKIINIMIITINNLTIIIITKICHFKMNKTDLLIIAKIIKLNYSENKINSLKF